VISALVSSYFIDDEKPEILKNCLNSLEGADEILSLVTHKKTPLGFADAWNRLATLAKGDYLVFIGDNNIQATGSLEDLAVPDTVTSPLNNGKGQEFWGFVFCMPRKIYEDVGLYDMEFNEGSHHEDTDLWWRLRESGVALKSIPSVNFVRSSGGRTINADPEFQAKSSRNSGIFKKKWGHLT
jgi:hypothetical protein